MRRLHNLLKYALRFIFFFISNLYGFFGYIMWSLLLLPLRIMVPDVYWKIESVLFKGLQAMVVTWLHSGGYGVVEVGDDISAVEDSEAVLLCNHQSTADTPLIMIVLWPKGMCSGKVMWIMDHIFRFTHFGLMSTIRNDFFIRQGKETRSQQGVLLEEHLKQHYSSSKRKWIILFPEGGFLRKRREASQEYARKNGYPVLQHVTLPRIGALKTILNTLGDGQSFESEHGDMQNGMNKSQEKLKWVVDMTIGYRNGNALDMLGMCVGYIEPQNIHVHFRAYPVSQIPQDSEDLLQWLYARYEEKEKLLDHFYQHGVFPPDFTGGFLPLKRASQLVFDLGAVILFHLFFIVSVYLQYTFVLKPLFGLLF
ncbi:acyl-CoA:lysophosphatidylglycerol acyltransferase 1-like [Pomacea canaliculata]|uniref:acyl-CoA:lysophosphatidylglycerol acyltransferase 1-like n=1 Tax=Pomacea canaliculata TaxID=400727 RepID=UPI000D731E15|nr:acyl-CoA:lysophosphatidylglycerol acyltransferase 1-like [Pomacea canaliculata]XP_025089153.1 acyl-CoA:lysophosphatidylglycerol acyltransferase 1-like [Pomacea canaliculata]